MSVADSLLEELIAEPTVERYLIYADLLQTQGNPRGELIALAVHAETTGTPPTERQRELEAQLTAALGDPIGGAAKMRLGWERGFVRDLTFVANAIPAIADTGWLDRDAFALVRSIGIHDPAVRETDAPVPLVVEAPFARTLERVAFGLPLCAPLSEAEVARLVRELPRLRGFELRARHRPIGAIAALETCERLEEIGLWAAIDEPLLATLIAAPWPHLRALRIMGHIPPAGQLPRCIGPLLDGERHPELVDLALMNCGFERELVLELARRPLGKRLRRLGLVWNRVLDETLEEVADAFANIDLAWPRPVGMAPLADEEYTLARRLRLGLDRSRAALPHAEAATVLGPDDYFHWTELGYVYGRIDQLDDKIRAMTRATEIDPKRWNAHVGLAAALRDLSRFEESEQAYRHALELEPNRAAIHNWLGLLYTRWDRTDDALAAFDRAVELATDAGDRASYLCNAIELLVECDRLADAVRYHARAREAAPLDIRLARFDGFLRIAGGAAADVSKDALALASRTNAENDILGVHALRAAALRALAQPADADRQYQKIADKADCPAWIAFAWLGQATLGVTDPFAAIAGVIDPALVGDAIATRVNLDRTDRKAHDTLDRADDQIHAAVCALAAAACAGRHDEARARARAFAAHLAGPAPIKHNDLWFELADLMRAATARVPELADLIATAYRVATGRRPPRDLDP